jgi:hypothetical protein
MNEHADHHFLPGRSGREPIHQDPREGGASSQSRCRATPIRLLLLEFATVLPAPHLCGRAETAPHSALPNELQEEYTGPPGITRRGWIHGAPFAAAAAAATTTTTTQHDDEKLHSEHTMPHHECAPGHRGGRCDLPPSGFRFLLV